MVEGILVFYFPRIRELFNLKLFVDTDADTRLARLNIIIFGKLLIIIFQESSEGHRRKGQRFGACASSVHNPSEASLRGVLHSDKEICGCDRPERCREHSCH